MISEENKKLEEGDVVLCTVDRISGTTVFVDIEDNGKGTIITSEISPGRIRNLRDYVVPGKKIVCKILNIDKQGNIHLSLRRTSEKEKKDVLERFDKEKSSKKILRSVLGVEAKKVIEKIPEKISFFLEKAKGKPEKLEKLTGKENAKKILNILEKRQKKQVGIKSYFKLTTDKENGVNIVKKILSPYKENIKYLSAEKFSLTIKKENYKEANKERDKILKKIEEKSEGKAEFEIIEK